MASEKIGTFALVPAGVLAGAVAGGQLVLLGKPFGGVLGVPGAVVGYIALTGLVLGCATGLLALRRTPSIRVAGCCAVLAGAGFAVAGLVSTPWIFVAAVVLACAAAGPLIVAGRILAFARPALLTGWHIVTAAGLAGAAGTASLCVETPGTGLVVAGLVAAALGAVAALTRTPAPQAEPRPRTTVPRGFLFGYAVVGLVLGGTVLPALHLLLFRWNAFGAEQTNLLLLAALPAVLVLVLPGPDASAIVPLLILAAGGPILVATAPGRTTLAIGIAVTLIAAARAARGLDLACTAAIADRTAAITALTVTVGGLGGLGLVALLSELSGTGTALTALAVPALALALLSGQRVPAPFSRSSAPAPALEGGTP